jgi:hypothetical protein
MESGPGSLAGSGCSGPASALRSTAWRLTSEHEVAYDGLAKGDEFGKGRYVACTSLFGSEISTTVRMGSGL